jgi:hypothetical protein
MRNFTRDAATQRVPILIVTRETRPSALDRVRQASANAVLTKPTLTDEIVREAGRLLTAGARRVGSSLTGSVSDDSTAVEKQHRHRTVLAKSHTRITTTTPPHSPPVLTRPSCDRPLKYANSYIGGVSNRHSEQWNNGTTSRARRAARSDIASAHAQFAVFRRKVGTRCR